MPENFPFIFSCFNTRRNMHALFFCTYIHSSLDRAGERTRDLFDFVYFLIQSLYRWATAAPHTKVPELVFVYFKKR
jgi:hypothetical protein